MVHLKWSEPLQDGGSEITGYEIRYMTLNSDTHSGKYKIKVTNTWELVGLVPHNKYSIHISAINGVGVGVPANLTVHTSNIGEHHSCMSQYSVTIHIQAIQYSDNKKKNDIKSSI